LSEEITALEFDQTQEVKKKTKYIDTRHHVFIRIHVLPR